MPQTAEAIQRKALHLCLKAVEVYAAAADECGTGLGAVEACQKVRNIVCDALHLKKRKIDEMDSSAVDW